MKIIQSQKYIHATQQDITRYDISRKKTPKDLQKCKRLFGHSETSQKQLLGVLWNGIKVFRVNGSLVRSLCDSDFLSGHDLVYGYIPKNEIWIDDDFTDTIDKVAILIHEIIERTIMDFTKADYEKSHTCADSVENIIRAIGQKR